MQIEPYFPFSKIWSNFIKNTDSSIYVEFCNNSGKFWRQYGQYGLTHIVHVRFL